MSHDQKPARVRIVANGAETDARRRGDATAIAPMPTTGPVDGHHAVTGNGAAGNRVATIVFALLFLGAAAAAAVAVTLAFA